MDEGLLQFGLRAFATLIVVVDPRVLGIVLAALAVQYILSGLAGFYATLTGVK